MSAPRGATIVPIHQYETHITDRPSEWGELPSELKERFWPGKRFFTLEEVAILQRLGQADWFLIENELRLRCGFRGCNRVHRYLTIGCIEQPFNDYRQIMVLENRFSQLERQSDRGAIGGAQVRVTSERHIVTNPGSIRPITPKDARVLVRRIRSVDPRFRAYTPDRIDDASTVFEQTYQLIAIGAGR